MIFFLAFLTDFHATIIEISRRKISLTPRVKRGRKKNDIALTRVQLNHS